MSLIRSKNTKPEIMVRSTLHRLGYRFRLHRRNLPGNPDIVLPRYHAVIFVNGCFWHFHPDCSNGKIPKSRSDYWADKLLKNVARDKKNTDALLMQGWKVLVVWECQVTKKSMVELEAMIRSFLGGGPEGAIRQE